MINEIAEYIGYVTMGAGALVVVAGAWWGASMAIFSTFEALGETYLKSKPVWWIIEATYHYNKVKPHPKNCGLKPLTAEVANGGLENREVGQ